MPRQRLSESATADQASGADEYTAVATPEQSVIEPGWSAEIRPKQNKQAVPRFTVPENGEEVIIKFIDTKPFAPVFQHWIMTSEGRRAFTCPASGPCPMCNRGDKAKGSDWFNVVAGLEDGWTLQVWYASADPSAAIRERAVSKRTSPINKAGQYFVATKRQASNGFNTYSIDPVREDELNDWGLKPLTAEELAEFTSRAYDASLVRRLSYAELETLAKQHFTD
jgi:hypothetical protein